MRDDVKKFPFNIKVRLGGDNGLRPLLTFRKITSFLCS